MIKVKELATRNLVAFMLLSLAVAVGYFMARPQTSASCNVPVFIGEEITVQKAATSLRAEKTVTGQKADRAIKAAVVPMPEPKTITPLPIVPPVLTFKVMPLYPVAALEQGTQGVVLLSIFIAADGQPGQIETKLSSGNADLDGAALSAARQWRFSPATQGGQALGSWLEVPVRFEVK